MAIFWQMPKYFKTYLEKGKTTIISYIVVDLAACNKPIFFYRQTAKKSQNNLLK
jgi:hypothetical protein